MSIYDLPKVENSSGPSLKSSKLSDLKKKLKSLFDKQTKLVFGFLILTVILSTLFGFFGGAVFGTYFYSEITKHLNSLNITLPGTEIPPGGNSAILPQEDAVIAAVKKASPSVVSIIITKDLPIYEQYYLNPFEDFGPFGFQIPQLRQKGTEKQEVGGGSGFIVSENGLVLTNKHVAEDKEAEYTVLTNDGKKYPAKVLARDPAQDLAILKIDAKGPLPVLVLGDSDNLQNGQTVIAIGNVLGEFRNSTSVGVVSGLGRTISAGGGGTQAEVLEGVIQTDAAINPGNSGGPLLNLKGQVIGINVAMAVGAENVGFAIPVNKAKKDIEQVKSSGKITSPFLGVYYTLITPELKEKYNLSVDSGAWIGRGASGEKIKEAIALGSAAEKAGLKVDDIILELNGEKITLDNSLAKIILKYNAGDKVTLKILRSDQEKIVEVTLGERAE